MFTYAEILRLIYLLIVAGITNVEVLGVGAARAIGVGRAGRRAPRGSNGAGRERTARCNNTNNMLKVVLINRNS